jgi:hypothetical protein
MITALKLTMSGNGHKILSITTEDGNVRIETNGNLPETHSRGIHRETLDEVWTFIVDYGTACQKQALGRF